LRHSSRMRVKTKKIPKLLLLSSTNIVSHKHNIYEHYTLNNREQEPGETIATYLTELKTIARIVNTMR
jgi:hypothetical protein